MRASSRARREARPRCYHREERLSRRVRASSNIGPGEIARAPLLAKGSEARARRVRRRYARVGRRSEPRAYRGNLSVAARALKGPTQARRFFKDLPPRLSRSRARETLRSSGSTGATHDDDDDDER